MKSADPRVKLLWMVICTSFALVFSKPLWMAGLCVFSLTGAFVLGGDLGSFAGRFRRFLALLAMVSALQIVFVRTGAPVLQAGGYILVTHDGLMRGATAVMRFFVILCAASVMANENSRRVIASLEKMGIPYVFCFMLMTSLRFLPLFSTSFSDSVTALGLRGIDIKQIPMGKKLGIYKSLVLPVVADAVVKAQDLAIAMEARGFGAMNRRTAYIKMAMDPRDWLSVAVLLGLGAAVIKYY